jgi:hypothetical protein
VKKFLKAIAKAIFVEVLPKNVSNALEQHSDKLSDLTDDCRKISLCTERLLTVYTCCEAMTRSSLPLLSSRIPGRVTQS